MAQNPAFKLRFMLQLLRLSSETTPLTSCNGRVCGREGGVRQGVLFALVVCIPTHRGCRRCLTLGPLMKSGLNLIGPQVSKLRMRKGWSQDRLATKLQLKGWSVSRDSVASLELQRRRVPDCELLFLARVLGVATDELFPRSVSLTKIGPQFQTGERLAIFPTRAEK